MSDNYDDFQKLGFLLFFFETDNNFFLCQCPHARQKVLCESMEQKSQKDDEEDEAQDSQEQISCQKAKNQNHQTERTEAVAKLSKTYDEDNVAYSTTGKDTKSLCAIESRGRKHHLHQKLIRSSYK